MLVPGTSHRNAAEDLAFHGFRDASSYPRGSFLRLGGRAVLPSPELAFLQAARSLSPLELACLGTELCATYQRGPVLTFCLPSRWGGFNLPKAALNYQIPLRARAARMARARYVLCDLCWPEHGLAVEYDSEEHHALSRAKDLDRVRALGLMGISVETVTTSQANDFVRLSGCVAALRRHMGLRSRPVPRDVDDRRFTLHRRLRRVLDGHGVLYVPSGTLRSTH